ncbi:MAG TPA: MgtC/SapB family protein [Acholeplasmataceae bacterium]|jgi:putative Mg2+ transporter-C (MgtC) family protein|nr:MgtC/SapB family protein [Acholeplasmataceae bacterium]
MDFDITIVLEQLLRVLAAAVVGALIGYEREIKSKPAGLLTFTLVCVGSCLLAILQNNIVLSSIEMIKNNPELIDAIKVDQGRIVAQVVSGIGFLGAGAIIHTRANVKGITTAALLWVVSALGLLIGTGGIYNYLIAALTVLIILPISYISRFLGTRLTKTRKVLRMRIVFDDNYEKDVFDNLSSQGVTVRKTFLVNKYIKDNVHMKESIIYISLPKSRSFADVMNQVSLQDYVYKVEEA